MDIAVGLRSSREVLHSLDFSFVLDERLIDDAMVSEAVSLEFFVTPTTEKHSVSVAECFSRLQR